MLEAPALVTTTPLRFAGLRLDIPKSEIRARMGPGLQAVREALAAQGVAAAGPWFTHHFRMEPTRWHFEIGVPVAREVAPAGAVESREWPAMRAARAVLRGDYAGLSGAWEALDAWVREQGLVASAELWEVYAAGPEVGPDPSSWRTELYRPVREG
jgi:effector-binding domain-containing protein